MLVGPEQVPRRKVSTSVLLATYAVPEGTAGAPTMLVGASSEREPVAARMIATSSCWLLAPA